MAKRYTLLTLILTAVALTILAAFTMYIDPFFVYGPPLVDNGYFMTEESYQNPGIAKHFDYDTAIIGSSMMQNSHPSQIDELFDTNSIKTTCAGGYPKNYTVILDKIYDTHMPEYVFWGLDAHYYGKNPNDTRTPLPEYIYDDVYYNDILYLLNRDVLFMTLSTSLGIYRQTPMTSRDSMFNWYDSHKDDFELENIAEHYNQGYQDITITDDEFMNNVYENVDKHLLPHIAEHPNTQFIIMFPPYNILSWKSLEYCDTLDIVLESEEYIISQLLAYDNVKIYYYQNIEDIVCDYRLYKDLTHYHPDINDYMFGCIYNGKYLLTEDNYLSEIQKLREMIATCDVPEIIDDISVLQ